MPRRGIQSRKQWREKRNEIGNVVGKNAKIKEEGEEKKKVARDCDEIIKGFNWKLTMALKCDKLQIQSNLPRHTSWQLIQYMTRTILIYSVEFLLYILAVLLIGF